MSLWRRFRQICISLRNPWEQAFQALPLHPRGFTSYSGSSLELRAFDARYASDRVLTHRLLLRWKPNVAGMSDKYV